jgi:hypothetical protein
VIVQDVRMPLTGIRVVGSKPKNGWVARVGEVVVDEGLHILCSSEAVEVS